MAVETDKNKIGLLLDRRVSPDGFYPSKEEVINKLSSGQALTFYYGIDPTGKDIHLGHTAQLYLLKGLGHLGHKIILLMGDFTAMIGDPTGKDKTRKPLDEGNIKENMKGYLEQVQKILLEGNFEVKHNSEWLKKMDMGNLIKIASHVTVQQMIVRDMFQERIKNNQSIALHEFLYPLMQGYDSVAMKVDGEIGGHDQIFNMLVGRDLEKTLLNKDKMVLATRLLIDAGTGKKMSKSEGEIISIKDEPSEIRRKILAMDDKMTKTVFELCTDKDQEWIDEESKKEPREFKEKLAEELIRIYHGEDKVKEAISPKAGNEGGNLATTSVDSGIIPSISQAKELIKAGAVEINGKVETNWKIEPKKGDKIKYGKGKFVEIK